ncbi:MAG: LTA synthase family protein [Ferruginibacter sp.]
MVGLLWLIIFQCTRVIYIWYNRGSVPDGQWGEISKACWIGLRMDLSMMAYFTAPFCLLLAIGVFFKKVTVHALALGYTGMLVGLFFLLVMTDLPVFQAWGNRLDAGALRYLRSPAEALASVNHLPLLWMISGWILAVIITVLGIRYLFYRWPDTVQSGRIAECGLLLFVFAAHLIPIRGGFQLAPLNQSSVYFSDTYFANLVALNPAWHFMHSLSFGLNQTENPYVYHDVTEAETICKKVYTQYPSSIELLDSARRQHAQVVLIVWESFTEKAVNLKHHGVPVTPGFNQLKNEGIYFSNAYATGDRTDKGIVGVLSGYPAQPTTSIIKMPQKAHTLPTLPRVFAKNGFQTAFFYGGELEFANMKSYLIDCGFHTLISKNDFEASDMNSKWGAHDGIVSERVLTAIRKSTKPSFFTWLTLSSHEPYETPVPLSIPGTDDVSQFLNSLHYTDAVVTNFIQQLKQTPNWKNTLVILVADHGHRLPRSAKQADFRIPILWMGGLLETPPQQYNQPVSQTDLAATLLHQFHWDASPFVWSKNSFADHTHRSAYFSFNDGLGWVQDSGFVLFDNVGKKRIEGSQSDQWLKIGQAVQQTHYQDFLNR